MTMDTPASAVAPGRATGRVGILLKLNKPEAVELARDLLDLLAARGVPAGISGAPEGSLPGAEVLSDEVLGDCRLLVVLGGDGTLLHGADLVSDRGVPILGVNLGTLGFLTSFSREQARAGLEQALDGTLPLERRMRLRVGLRRGAARHARNGQLPAELAGPGVTVEGSDADEIRHACNDAVISQGAIARLLEFDAFLDGQAISTYRADGLIVATPSGSTAYNLAAGGPLLTPELQGMVISPICPHTLTNRPLVVPAGARLSVRLGEDARHVMLTVDGQWATAITPDDVVEIQAAAQPLLLHRPVDTSYFDVLRQKLHWGVRGGRRRGPTLPEDGDETEDALMDGAGPPRPEGTDPNDRNDAPAHATRRPHGR